MLRAVVVREYWYHHKNTGGHFGCELNQSLPFRAIGLGLFGFRVIDLSTEDS